MTSAVIPWFFEAEKLLKSFYSQWLFKLFYMFGAFMLFLLNVM